VKWKKRIALSLTALFSHKAALATTAAGAAATTAHQLGRDPVPWLIGTFAVVVVYAHWRPDDKPKAAANGVISIFLGGVGAPFVGAYFVKWGWVDPAPINDWVLAGILGAGWPWLVPVVFDLFKRRAGRAVDGN
jgi:hypothetical protein